MSRTKAASIAELHRKLKDANKEIDNLTAALSAHWAGGREREALHREYMADAARWLHLGAEVTRSTPGMKVMCETFQVYGDRFAAIAAGKRAEPAP